MSSSENNVTPFSATDPVKATVTSVGGASAGGTASSSKPTITGTGEPGQVVNLYDGGRWLGSTTVASDGKWSIAAPNALKAGNHSFTAICVGTDGGNGLSSEPVSVKVPAESSTIPPTPAIGGVIDNVGPVKGNVASGGTTDDSKPTFTGSGAHAGDIVIIKDGSAPIGSAIVKPDGTWSVKPDAELGNGPHTITAVEKNPSTGATSTPSPATTINVDTTVPNAPSNVHITDPTTGGNVPNGGITGNPSPVISGIGHAGDIVTVTDNGTPIGSTVVKPDGTWTLTPTPSLGNGSHNIGATETNPATGATSTPSPGTSINVDTSVPAAPAIGGVIDNVGPVTGNVASGGTTDDSKPTFTGSGANAGDIIIIKDGSAPIGSAIVKPDGTWSVTPEVSLGNGSHNITAVEKNPATGITGPASPATTITVDTTTPGTPTINGLYDNTGAITGNIASGGITDETRPILSGTGSAGNVIVVKNGATVLGSAVVGPDGKWSFTPTSDLPDGTHHATAVAQNAAGATGSPSADYPFTIDTAPAATPAITGVADAVGNIQGNVAAGGRTDDRAPTVSGTGHAGDTITIKDGANVIGAATVQSNGTWSFKPVILLADGGHDLTAIATNALGTSSAPSAHYAFTIAADPVMPLIISATGVQDGQEIHRGDKTNDTTFVLHGVGQPGNTIVVVQNVPPNPANPTGVVGAALVDSNGNWSLSFSNPVWIDAATGPATRVALGIYDQTTQQIYSWPFNIYNGASTLTQLNYPRIEYVTDHVGPIQGNVPWGATTDDAHPVISGFASSATIVKIFDNGTLIGSTATDADGTWSFTPSTALNAGRHNMTTVASKSGLADSDYSNGYAFTVASDPTPTLARFDDHVGPDQGPGAISNGAHDMTFTIDADPAAYFQKASTHVQGDHSGHDTVALTGDHQILDLTSLTGTTAAAKISGVEVFDLGGHQNTLKVSLLDVLNLGEQDLFIHDGKQQVVVKGATGDAVDLSNTHVAGVADGQWEQHGTAQVGGVTYAVYEHSGAHVELLVQQGVATTVHQ